ncbi:MAG: GntR family transcriptional regulator [Clostridia bacterium]|nr:GntR family transcriptional regulator [Clostridia bacterium]
MAWSFSPHRPVYYQVAERIRQSILSGEYASGEQIPSVRQLALEAAVNPNTIQHAFSELEDQGLIVSRGTTGRFVTEDIAVIDRCRELEAKILVEEFTQRALQLRIPCDTLIEMIKAQDIDTDRKEDGQ